MCSCILVPILFILPSIDEHLVPTTENNHLRKITKFLFENIIPFSCFRMVTRYEIRDFMFSYGLRFHRNHVAYMPAHVMYIVD